jgi:D-aminopeptidase
VARTGVTALDFGGNAFASPVPAGAAVLNGNGECTGMMYVRECGVIETPVFLTATMQLGRVYDAALEILVAEEPDVGVVDVVIPVVAECDDSFLSDPRRVRVTVEEVRAALNAARASAGGTEFEEGTVGSGTGMSCLGYKGGIGTASRVLPDGTTVGILMMTNFGDRHRLTVGGVPVGRLLPDHGHRGPHTPAGSCFVVVVTDAPIDPAGCSRLARRAGLGLARVGSVATNGSGEIFLAAATGLRTPRGTSPDRSPITGAGLDPYFEAVVDATEEAALNSLLAATTVVGRDGNTSVALPFDDVRDLLTKARHALGDASG